MPCSASCPLMCIWLPSRAQNFSFRLLAHATLFSNSCLHAHRPACVLTLHVLPHYLHIVCLCAVTPCSGQHVAESSLPKASVVARPH